MCMYLYVSLVWSMYGACMCKHNQYVYVHVCICLYMSVWVCNVCIKFIGCTCTKLYISVGMLCICICCMCCMYCMYLHVLIVLHVLNVCVCIVCSCMYCTYGHGMYTLYHLYVSVCIDIAFFTHTNGYTQYMYIQTYAFRGVHMLIICTVLMCMYASLQIHTIYACHFQYIHICTGRTTDDHKSVV
jgi:hypothetical protein